MGDGWVCIAEDFLQGCFAEKYNLEVEDFGVDDDDDLYYAKEGWEEGCFIQYSPETGGWQVQVDNGECGDSYEDLRGAIDKMECFLEK